MNAILLTPILVYLLCLTMLSLATIRWRSKKAHRQPSLSVVIAAHNEADHLKALIPALLAQAYPSFEVIVVLDRASDDSHAYLSGFGKKLKVIEISTTPPEWDHKKYALTTGMKEAIGEWIVLTDADCVPSSTQWLQSMAREMAPGSDILIGISPVLGKGSLLAGYAAFEAFMTYFLYAGVSLLHKPYMAVGRNMAIKKSFWIEKNGYESMKEIKGGDDDLFIQRHADRHNSQLVLSGKKSLVFTYPATSWRAFWHQKIRHFSVSSAYGLSSKMLISLFHLLHISAIFCLIMLSSSSFFLVALIFYLFINFVCYVLVAAKVGAGFMYLLMPILDLMYACMSPILGVCAQLKKDIKWKD